MTIGEIIKVKRTDAKLTQKALASKLGIAQNTIAQYESGLRTPKIEQLNRIAEILNISVVSFLSDDGYDPLGTYNKNDIAQLTTELESLQTKDPPFSKAIQTFDELENAFLSSVQDVSEKELLSAIQGLTVKLNSKGQWLVYKIVKEIVEINKYKK